MVKEFTKKGINNMLNWEWDKKIGMIKYKEYSTSIYEGNAMLIEIWEEKPDSKDGKYQLMKFLYDKKHFKNCLADYNGDWLFRDMISVEFYTCPEKELWIWIQELVKRGIQVTFISRPFN